MTGRLKGDAWSQEADDRIALFGHAPASGTVSVMYIYRKSPSDMYRSKKCTFVRKSDVNPCGDGAPDAARPVTTKGALRARARGRRWRQRERVQQGPRQARTHGARIEPEERPQRPLPGQRAERRRHPLQGVRQRPRGERSHRGREGAVCEDRPLRELFPWRGLVDERHRRPRRHRSCRGCQKAAFGAVRSRQAVEGRRPYTRRAHEAQGEGPRLPRGHQPWHRAVEACA